MTSPNPKRPEPNAGAFLGPDILAPIPMRTLSDDYRDVPADPPEERVPSPEPRGLIARIIERLKGGPAKGQ
jgi:hypothetical protein